MKDIENVIIDLLDELLSGISKTWKIVWLVVLGIASVIIGLMWTGCMMIICIGNPIIAFLMVLVQILLSTSLVLMLDYKEEAKEILDEIKEFGRRRFCKL